MNLWRERLSAQERACLQLMAAGCLNRQIARRLGITPGAVKHTNRRVFQKLGVLDRTQAAVFAIKFEVVDVAAVFAEVDQWPGKV